MKRLYSRRIVDLITRSPLCLFVLCAASCASIPKSTTDAAFTARYSGFKYCEFEAVEQLGQFSCGPACVSSVLTYWGADISEAELLEKYPSAEEGRYSVLELQTMAIDEGLKAYALSMNDAPRSELEDQILRGRPLICAIRLPRHLYAFDWNPIVRSNYRALIWKVGFKKLHFVTVFGIGDDKVLLADPARGITTMPWRRFERGWGQMRHASLLISQ